MITMCNFWTCILTRDLRVLWDRDIKGHEELIAKFKLKDTTLEDCDFVRLEIVPDKLISKKPSDWSYKVDEAGTLPKWYSQHRAAMEAIVWKEWKQAMKKTLWKFDLTIIEKVIKEIKSIPYLKMTGKIDASWHVSYGKTWDAAWDARLYCLVKLAVSAKAKIAVRHVRHANARMEVWRRGYALKCDVNGKLYVYAKKAD